jgi:hypothetical protein
MAELRKININTVKKVYYEIALMMQTFGIVCLKWYSPKQGIETPVAACLVTFALLC